MLLTPGAQQLGPVDSAIYRIVEITLGSFVGLGVSLLLWPARAHGLVISTAARALSLLADLLDDWLAVLGGGQDRTRITQLQNDIRAAMARLEIVGRIIGVEFRLSVGGPRSNTCHDQNWQKRADDVDLGPTSHGSCDNRPA